MNRTNQVSASTSLALGSQSVSGCFVPEFTSDPRRNFHDLVFFSVASTHHTSPLFRSKSTAPTQPIPFANAFTNRMSKQLIVFDFDWSFVDQDTDRWVFEVLSTELRRLLQSRKSAGTGMQCTPDVV